MKLNFVLIRKLATLVCICPIIVSAQTMDTLDAHRRTLSAGPQYAKGFLHKLFWGKHYRKEWTTPVEATALHINALYFNPTVPINTQQYKAFYLQDNDARQYILRSIDRKFPFTSTPEYKGTFVESLINDQVSTSHPYAEPVVAPLAAAAGLYHTKPVIGFIAQPPSSDTQVTSFGNELFLLEQRPFGNWKQADNLANSDQFINTERVIFNTLTHNDQRVDQLQYIRSRLFDMLIGDWDRSETHWAWASAPPASGDSSTIKTVYKAIPIDRQQAFSKFDGILVNILKSSAGIGHLQSFDHSIHNVRVYNYEARNLDRQLANETTLNDWLEAAKKLRDLITDEVIASAVQQLPREVFPISANELQAKLRSRRNKLEHLAETYYRFLALEVGVAGTMQQDRFVIEPGINGAVQLKIFATDHSSPYYTRTFQPDETNELRIYGIGGEDRFEVKDINTPMRIRIIGGSANDTYITENRSRVHVYDSRDQLFNNATNLVKHLSNDTLIHAYQQDEFLYSKFGFGPSVFYSREDRIYFGVNYKVLQNKWRRHPFANRHHFYVRYSVQQNSFHVGYEGMINQAFGNWNIVLNAEYDWIRWTNFYGVGNESKMLTDDRDYHRIRSRQGIAGIGINRTVGRHNEITFMPFYQTIKLVNDKNRFLSRRYFAAAADDDYQFTRRHYAGINTFYSLRVLNDALIPTHGYLADIFLSATKDINRPRSFANIGGQVHVYLPLGKNFVLSVNNGAAHMFGKPEFFQLNNIGGRLLRGYRRERFWGETVYHNNNELQFIFDVRSWLFNGRAGIVGFADQGRVWLKGESSQRWHVGYGGGIFIAPFNKVYVSVMYGISKESGLIHLDLRRSL